MQTGRARVSRIEESLIEFEEREKKKGTELYRKVE